MQDKAFFETKTHGEVAFPYVVYKGDIPNFIHSFPLHWHDEMEFIYVTDGNGIVTVRSSRYEVSSGDIIVIPPQTVHSISSIDNCSMLYYNIIFSLSFLDNDDICHNKYFEPLNRNEIEPIVYVRKDSELNKLLTPYLTSLIENRQDLAASGELMIKSVLFAALHHIIKSARPIDSDKCFDNSTYDKLKKLLIYVREHYSEQITIKTAADICAYSCSHFMKIFKHMTGQSFTEYLINYRLNAAANALSLTSDRIIDIAFNCGFENLSYFSRAFLRKYGVTPTEYRRNVAP